MQDPFPRFLVPRRDLVFKRLSHVTIAVSSLAIYSVIIPLALCDIWMQAYQAVHFRIWSIPPVPRSKYVVFDRGRLAGLNLRQRFNCWYCDYANGVLAWMKEVGTVTETYSCAIKHSTPTPAQQNDGFYEYADFVTPRTPGK